VRFPFFFSSFVLSVLPLLYAFLLIFSPFLDFLPSLLSFLNAFPSSLPS
jgi:hypothetical protein